MTISLRPHHMLCILTYVGKGYSPAFIANYDRIAERISGGEDILLVAGPDDICAPLLDDAAPHCTADRVTARDRTAAQALSILLGHPVRAGTRLRPDATLLTRLRDAYAAGRFAAACAFCAWHPLCTAVSGAGYDGARIASG